MGVGLTRSRIKKPWYGNVPYLDYDGNDTDV